MFNANVPNYQCGIDSYLYILDFVIKYFLYSVPRMYHLSMVSVGDSFGIQHSLEVNQL